MANWDIRCQECGEVESNVSCSMFTIPPCLCGGERRLYKGNSFSSKTAIFPFELNHIDGKPMTIESLSHLRRVERDFGVVFSAFSKDNINDMDPAAKELPKFRGDDPDTRRNYNQRYRK